MTPDERKELADAVRIVECEIRSEERELSHHLILLELCLLPVAFLVMVFVPAQAAAIALLPSLALRGYQVWRAKQH